MYIEASFSRIWGHNYFLDFANFSKILVLESILFCDIHIYKHPFLKIKKWIFLYVILLSVTLEDISSVS